MSKAFREWKAERMGLPPLCRGPLPKRLFTLKNYRMTRRVMDRRRNRTKRIVNDMRSTFRYYDCWEVMHDQT